MKLILAYALAMCLGIQAETKSPDMFVDGFKVGTIRLMARERGSWKMTFAREAVAPGLEYAVVTMTNEKPLPPPAFNLAFNLPKKNMSNVWRPNSQRNGYGMHWSPDIDHIPGAGSSDFCHWMPLYATYTDDGLNGLTFAASEPREPVRIKAGIREENCRLYFSWHFYDDKAAARTNWTVRLRLDSRRIPWCDAVADASDWICAASGTAIARAPKAAYEPLYSSWYAFHQNVFADKLEAECARAARAGMKTIIVDDGWQTEDTNRGYAFCGDWQVAKRRFPDMRAHVAKVHALGMKYMLWYSVPFVGRKSANYSRFKDKFLFHNGGLGTGVLDPRYPEVREFLISTYERAIRDWDIDGLKLDFIDNFRTPDNDPAAKKGFKGCDYRKVPEAAERLLSDVYRRLSAIKPDILIEYRQAYIGPAIRAGANMLRVGDCPADAWRNRVGIVNLRTTSRGTAVHSDMLEWHPSVAVEQAARDVLAVMFATVQYSMRLTEIPESHVAMIAHWSQFGHDHMDALQLGTFRAFHPELNYPLLCGESTTERIWGVYETDRTVAVGALDRRIYVLNGADATSVVLDLPAAARVTVRDTFGKTIATQTLAAGLSRVACPVAGYLEIVASGT